VCSMMDVEVGEWDTGKGIDMCVTLWTYQWESGTQDKVVACVIHDGRRSGTVGQWDTGKGSGMCVT
jgi:hypothetical protein